MTVKRPENLFNAFYEAVRGNEVLDTRTTTLLQLGTALAVGCGP